MPTFTDVERKQVELIRRLVEVEDVVVLDEVGRVLDSLNGPRALRRLDDDEVEDVLRELLDG